MEQSKREYWKQNQTKRKVDGKCQKCGNQAKDGKTRCEACKAKRRTPDGYGPRKKEG